MQINVDNEYEITTCNGKSLFTSIVVFAQQMQIRIQNYALIIFVLEIDGGKYLRRKGLFGIKLIFF